MEKRSSHKSNAKQNAYHEALSPREGEGPEKGEGHHNQDEIGGDADGGVGVKEALERETLGPLNGKVPRSLHRAALEDSDDNGADADTDANNSRRVEDPTQDILRKDAEVRCDDGQLGERGAGGVEDVGDKHELGTS